MADVGDGRHVLHGKEMGCRNVGVRGIKWVQPAVEGIVVRRRVNRSGERGEERAVGSVGEKRLLQ